MASIEQAKRRREETRDDLERSQKTVDDLLDARAKEKEPSEPRRKINEKLDRARETRDKRMRDWERARDDLKAARKKAKQERESEQEQVIASPGAPHWGGCEDILLNEVVPLFQAAGLYRNSGKRTATYGNPDSDHHVSQVIASAADCPTANNTTLRNQIAQGLGIASSVTDFTAYYITRNGRRYRLQFIAATHGTGPHLHVGCRLT